MGNNNRYYEDRCMDRNKLAMEMLKTAKELIGAGEKDSIPGVKGDIDLKAMDKLMKKFLFKKKHNRGDLAYYELESDETFIYAGVSERKPGTIYIASEDYNNPYRNPFEYTQLKNTTELDRFLFRNKKKFK